MAYDPKMNIDDRGDEQKYIARGHRGNDITVTISDGQTSGEKNFTAYGKLYGLYIPSFSITGSTSTITDIDIRPQDAPAGEANVVEIGSLSLAEGTFYFLRVAEYTTNNLEAPMFGQMTIVITVGVAPSGADDDIVVVPILGQH